MICVPGEQWEQSKLTFIPSRAKIFVTLQGNYIGQWVGDYFLLTQRYYVNRTYDSFHQTIADIKDECLALSLLCAFENVLVVVVLAENVLS